MFGENKLMDVLKKYGEESPEKVKNEIIKSLDKFETDDDITMVLVRRS